jgi:phosphoserine aminotransferase
MSAKLFFTPGPSQMYFTVDSHIKEALRSDIPSISHRSKAFTNLFESCTDTLRSLLGLSEGFHIFFTGSATEIWERISQNLIEKESYHFVNGSFSKRFHQIATEYGINALKADPGFGKPFGDELIQDSSELISITYNETSAGFQFDQPYLEKLRNDHPDKLIAADVVSIAPSVSIPFDHIDTAYFSVQKSFGLPAGLGVWIVNNRAIEKAHKLAEKGRQIGSYHSIPSLYTAALKNQTPETPNVLGIYLLQKVAQDMLTKGKEMMHRDTAYKAALLYQLFDSNQFLSPFIETKANRSKTVCVADVDQGNAWLLNSLEKKGLIVGKGYGDKKESQIRIANFPTHSNEQIEMLVDQINNLSPN